MRFVEVKNINLFCEFICQVLFCLIGLIFELKKVLLQTNLIFKT